MEAFISANREFLSKSTLILFAATCGLSVANVYYSQPLLDSIAHELNVNTGSVGLIGMFTQIGYALGLMLLVPLGDMLNRKKLVLIHLFLSTLFLTCAALATNFYALLFSLLGVGFLAVVVQAIVAFTATLAKPSESGEAVGLITSGVILGILLARTIAGFISDFLGWRFVYFLSALTILILAALLTKTLPITKSTRENSYRQLLKSSLSIFIEEPILRLRALYSFLIFASFSVLWTSMVLPLSSSPFSLSRSAIGLFGIAGVAGVLAASQAGKLCDKGYANNVTGWSFVTLVFSWLLIAMMNKSLWIFGAGVVLLDFAVQAVHVTNQSVIFTLRPNASSRLVACYMIFYSLGSGIGAIASTKIYEAFGWIGVCLLGFSFSISGLMLWLLNPSK